MVTEFIVENETTREKTAFGQSPSFDFLYKSDGLSWGSPPATHNTYSYPGQVGESISSTKINGRDISITGYVYYWLTQDEKAMFNRESRLGYAYSKIEEKKEFLNRLINPNDFIKLTIGNYYIEGKPSNPVTYGDNEDENNTYFCKFMINIYCSNPMFKKTMVSKTTLSGRIPRFHFPLVFRPDHGMLMSIRQNYLMLSVENEGNVSIGGKIILTAENPVKNPVIENVGTGETIRISKTLAKGEVVTINTTDGKDKGITGEYRGVVRNYFEYWDFNNTWFKFQPGTSLIGYSAEDGTETSLYVAIELNPEKFNLENM